MGFMTSLEIGTRLSMLAETRAMDPRFRGDDNSRRDGTPA